MKQCTDFTPKFKKLLEDEAVKLGMDDNDDNATLSVHLRLTDKIHDEAKENATLSNETIVLKVSFTFIYDAIYMLNKLLQG